MEKTTFGAGCFSGVEARFRKIKGVTSAAVGYGGGAMENPAYEDVCSGRTGHTEAVEVIFGAELISYDQLLDVFRSIHDPTTLNRQGPDVGSQYRPAIFTHDAGQVAAGLFLERRGPVPQNQRGDIGRRRLWRRRHGEPGL